MLSAQRGPFGGCLAVVVHRPTRTGDGGVSATPTTAEGGRHASTARHGDAAAEWWLLQSSECDVMMVNNYGRLSAVESEEEGRD